jgi:hypothetical protein
MQVAAGGRAISSLREYGTILAPRQGLHTILEQRVG